MLTLPRDLFGPFGVCSHTCLSLTAFSPFNWERLQRRHNMVSQRDERAASSGQQWSSSVPTLRPVVTLVASLESADPVTQRASETLH